jgi:hypothetical protein
MYSEKYIHIIFTTPIAMVLHINTGIYFISNFSLLNANMTVGIRINPWNIKNTKLRYVVMTIKPLKK